MTTFRSNGKLLITGEYVVLDGAVSLSLPTKFGQSLNVEKTSKQGIHWIAFDHKNKKWLEVFFEIEEVLKKPDIAPLAGSISEEAYLLKILQTANSLNPNLLKNSDGFIVTTQLDFPKNWGLGTSSTLINNIAQWFQIDAYKLLQLTFGGSGYDIAAAQYNNAITYELSNEKRNVLNVDFDPSFKDELFFVHLNRKQNSRDSIQHYRDQSKAEMQKNIAKISSLTSQFLHCETLKEFELLVEIHETIISKILNTPKVKSELFPDFPGVVKSLGGWGGDFVLATGKEAAQDYFRGKGYKTIISYNDMVFFQ
ncbi:mevalonate kinase [Gillisia sp. Hel_I_86]|uniref:GYDIA family GHMP kinase n=1 Tax=Gillisia sp. Hel_I_86 TaxID=1249981 RepID=UPI001199C5C0|nr:GYDIA family GHMP kinase [Gillisia sp. Hel_I_86]TVZ26813.1 mevalonate kinase [Gillisia sp. Hel_I_86]